MFGTKIMSENQLLNGYANGITPNGLRLCVCLPIAQGFKLPTNLIGQIAQNRCYTLAR